MVTTLRLLAITLELNNKNMNDNGNNKKLIDIQNLNVSFNGHKILNNINFNIYEKQIITIIGPNGAGKSTLIKAILGFIKLTSGTIIKAPDLKVGYVPQKINFPEQIPMTVLQFLKLNNKTINPLDSPLNVELKIKHLLNKSIHKLSGGELQRILLTKALYSSPNLLLLDEPTQSIDLNGQAEFYKLCSYLQQQLNCAILMASHDLHIVMSGINSVICLNKHICCHGLATTVSQHPEFIQLFGEHMEKLAVYHHHHDHKHE